MEKEEQLNKSQETKDENLQPDCTKIKRYKTGALGSLSASSPDTYTKEFIRLLKEKQYVKSGMKPFIFVEDLDKLAGDLK